MVAAQLFLNLAPLAACLFVCFFGRLFSDLLRLVIVFFIVVSPLLAGSLQEQIDGTTEGLTPVALLGSLWSLLAGVGCCYMGIKRPSFAKKLETVGISFLVVLILNSYYLGYLHGELRHEANAVVTYMEWMVPVATLVISCVFHFVRHLPGLPNWMDSFTMALVGAFVGLQVLCGMDWSITEGLSYKRLLNHDFGCQTTECYITMSVFVALIFIGTIMQFLFFRAGSEGHEDETWDDGLEEVMGKLKAMLSSLASINKAIALYSNQNSAAEAAAAMVHITEDIYKFLGATADVVLATFAIGLVVNVIEMHHHDLMRQLKASTSLSVCLITVCVLSVGLTGFAWFLRLGKKNVESSEWKKQNMIFLVVTGICWPILVFSSCFVLTIGGEELAYMDVPLINNKLGWHDLPLGCDSHLPADDIPSDQLSLGDLMSNTHRDTSVDIGGEADGGSWDGDHCHDGIWNMDEDGPDCGGRCFAACLPCQCSYVGRTTNGTDVEMGCGLHNDSATMSDGSVLTVPSYRCYVMDGPACAASGIHGELVHGDWRFCNPLPTRDGLEFSSVHAYGPQAVVHPDLGPEQPPEPEPEPPKEVWYCAEAVCYACETDACLGKCEYVRRLGLELPILVWLMWGITIVSLVSALTASGELGGLYLLVERLCTYLTILNFIQGLAISIIAFVMMGDTDAIEHAVDGDASLWFLAFVAGVFLTLESLVGIVGTKFADGAVGGVLWGYLVSLVLTLFGFVGVFFAAAYYANNAHEYVDKHWDKYIYPELIAAQNSTVIPEFRGVAHLSKDEFVEYARGSFRCLIIGGVWIMFYMTALVIATKMTITRRNGDGAAFARERMAKGKGATTNPMYSDMQVMGGEESSPSSARGGGLGENLLED
eukprot:SAG22_NODE_41_length_25488_cov_6.133719_2_plen_881_part_00